MSSQNEISPLQLQNTIDKIYNGGELKDFDFKNNWSEIEKVFEMAKIMIIPKPMVHGKNCSNCNHTMHCKSIKCPNCFTEQRKRKRQGLAIPAVPQPAAEVEPAEVEPEWWEAEEADVYNI
jgi:RNA polymerase subunit RPABC4/transcription elongation factor Spt4|tara:strand:+ start:106 stop:468 length:363 start_codon:yes stop_codon:yes gene_type:complete